MPSKASSKKDKAAVQVPEPAKPVANVESIKVEPVAVVEPAPEKKQTKKKKEAAPAPTEPQVTPEVKEVVEEKPKEAKKEKKEKKAAKKRVVKAKTITKAKAKTTKKVNKKKAKVSKKKDAVVETKLSDEKRPRYFKLIYENAENGRFSGNKPKQAANKALTSIVKAKEKKGEPVIDVDIRFSLKECTRWNKKKCKKGADNEKIIKVYNYLGKREHLEKQVVVDHIQKEKVVDENVLKTGKILKEDKLTSGDVKYYMELKKKDKDENGKPTEVTENFIVKKINVKDAGTNKPTGEFKYAIVNEIKYNFTNKVQKFKTEQTTA